MTPDRWRQVTEIFHAALARDVGARDAFLRHACRGDPSLRAEVDALVAAHGEAGSFGSDPLFPEGAPRLSPGTRLGTYHIEDLLGVGGMGEVYRARDTELGRQVAIKILPGEWLADPDRRARLDKEARVLAALNHPHVASIYGVVEADGVRGLVLELVEGATLAERLTEGPLSLTEALNVALQIADALDATHEKGIVHRDLKPANIKITPDGVVKVLDFGVAKVRQSGFPFHADHEPPTGTAGQTGDEVMIGTAAYMSPEQARGKPVDKRADIWAFGCVLYEMLSGRRPFVGETTTDVLAAIVDREPEWTALPATVPSSVRHVLERCLEKDPKRRLRDIGDARVELEDSLKPHTPATGVQTGESNPRGRRFGPWAAVGVALLVVAVTFLTLPFISSRFGNTPRNAAVESAKSAATDPAPPPNPQPVVVLMDSPGRVYDAATEAAGSTNADDISDALRDLAVVSFKENTSSTWHREEQVIRQNPDLIVSHLSCLLDERMANADQAREDHLVAVAANRLTLFFGYLGTVNPRTRFLVYSRSRFAKKDVADAWVGDVVARFPTLKGRVFTMPMPGGRTSATFRHPATAEMLRTKVKELLPRLEY